MEFLTDILLGIVKESGKVIAKGAAFGAKTAFQAGTSIAKGAVEGAKSGGEVVGKVLDEVTGSGK